jgi:hypothetical protein
LAEEPHEISAAQVRAAIDKGVAYLKSTQSQDGSWPDIAGPGAYHGGVTALNTLALLTAGVPADDEQLKRAIGQVRDLPLEKTYVVALQAMVLSMAHPKEDGPLIRQDVEWLERAQIRQAPDAIHSGGWSYSKEYSRPDNSNSQFALLALYEAQRVGVHVSDQTWSLAQRYWLSQQNVDGSWGYYPIAHQQQQGYGSMTCAGIASVFITSGRTSDADAEITDNGLNCCTPQGDDPAAKAIEKGRSWLGNNFSVFNNPGQGSLGSWQFYYLYALERVGRMTSHRFFTRRDGQNYDWYRMGAEVLIGKQDALSGFWRGEGIAESNAQIATSFSLLFLAKGRRPVLISKARYGPGNDWDRHRQDLAHLTSYVETKWKRDYPLGLSWQIVDLADASVDDLLQTPVLYISGSQPPPIMDQAKKLREYIDRGGFIFAEACCKDSAGFDKGFRELMDKVFDEPEYRLTPVGPQSPIWIAEEPVAYGMRPNLWSVDYGCRTSVVYVAPPEDETKPMQSGLSCYWEVASDRDQKAPAPVQQQIAAALSMGINVLAYATNRELKTKDETFQLADEPKKDSDSFERGKRYIANIRHAGGSDAAPGALPGLLRAASRELKARFSTQPRQVKLTDPDLFNYDLLFMHGRGNFRLNDEERKQFRKYLERGTLIADSICGSADFTKSFREEINGLFADKGLKLEPIPATHAMFTRDFGGYDLAQVGRREPRGREDGAPLEAKTRTTAPELEGLKIGDRYAVLFSPYDLSCALEKHDSLECEGYTKEDAERIGLNLLLYATFGP